MILTVDVVVSDVLVHEIGTSILHMSIAFAKGVDLQHKITFSSNKNVGDSAKIRKMGVSEKQVQ